MHITIRRYKTDSPKEVTPIVNERFFPLISSVTGFVAYYGIEIGEDSWLSISVFETAAGAEESDRVAAKFIRDNPDLARLVKSPPIAVAGSVVAYLERP
jgi:hypothetical protein